MKQKSKNKQQNPFGYLFWWNIDQDELKKQIENYDQLGMLHSARGVSFLYLLLAVVITVLTIYLKLADVSTLIDAFILLILGLFIYRGHRWAMTGAMIVWTLERAYIYLASSSIGNLTVAVLWWTVYMRSFWLAFRVEQERIKLKTRKADT